MTCWYNQWERLIVLRLGKFRAMKGPGLCFIIPIVDTVAYWIDVRVITTSPTALHLRAMNMLYEGLKQNSTIVIVPSTALDSMQLGGVMWITAMAPDQAEGKS